MQLWAAGALLLVFVMSAIRPHWGISLFALLLPLETILPGDLLGSTPFLTSPIAIVGAVATAGAALGLLREGRLRLGPTLRDPVKIAGLLFIVWIFASHPTSAWYGANGARNWVFTFVQLWSWALIAGVALDTPRKHTVLMLCFAAACLLSAGMAVATGTIGASRAVGVRSAGYAAGINASARYFAVAIVFTLALGVAGTSLWRRAISALCVAFLLVGIVFTQSRTGLFLGLLAVVLVPLLSVRRKGVRDMLLVAGALLIAAVLLPQGGLDDVQEWFAIGQTESSQQLDSVSGNIRYLIWQTGAEMWFDSPLSGIGIGRFPESVSERLPAMYENRVITARALNPHNMYIGLLAETGLIGMLLFLVMLALSLRQVWRAHTRFLSGSVDQPRIWVAVLVLLIVGGLTKDDALEKVLWMTLGAASSCAAFAPRRARIIRRGAEPRQILGPNPMAAGPPLA